MSANIITFTQDALTKENLQDKGWVLVDFWAAWCGPCKMLAPTVEALCEELAGQVIVGKLNIDDYTDFAISLGVVSIPTLVLFHNGEEAGRLVGLQTKDAILEMIRGAQQA
ncbi:MAG: thioredoxin [Clostridia bacterium]|nr:thioredoxin [Clostridia bacterium]MBQ8973135.1 thioredoxin [Clostridia bacterium]